MKRVYTFVLAAFLSSAMFAQIGPDWWQMLPVGWQDAIPTTPTLTDYTIKKVSEFYVDDAASLAEIWSSVSAQSSVIAIDRFQVGDVNGVEGGLPDNAADFTANAVMFWNDAMLYAMFKIEDEEYIGAESVEWGVAPYNGQYNPGRTIHPSGYEAAGGVMVEPGDYVFGPLDDWGRRIPGPEYVEMAKYGIWRESGAFKCVFPDPQTFVGADKRPPTEVYSLKNDSLGNVSQAPIAVDVLAAFEAKGDGYYYLVGAPLNSFKDHSGAVVTPAEGTKWRTMLKANDKDTEGLAHFGWAPYENNSYWALGFYGDIITFTESMITSVASVKSNTGYLYMNNGFIMLDRAGQVNSLEVFSVTGSKVLSVSQLNSSSVNVSQLKQGVYVVKANRNEGVLTQKIVVK